MNFIPNNYSSKLSIRETQEAQLFIERELMDILSQKLEFIQVREPKISSENISTSNNEGEIKRPINFDSSSDNVIYYIYNKYRYWFANTFKKLEIKNNNGIASHIKYINRDEEITNTKSLEKNTIQIEIRYDNKDASFKKGLELTELIFASIKQLETKLISKYASLKRTLPSKNIIKDSSKLEMESEIYSAIDELASEYGCFSLVDNFDNKLNKSLFFNYKIQHLGYSKYINKAFEIFSVADRRVIEDLEPFSSGFESVMEEYVFAKEILNNEDIRSISITIDVDTLSMLLLQKAHILELQSGKNIEDIEKILINANIKHL